MKPPPEPTERDRFVTHLLARLDQGYREYGDRSFERHADHILEELQQEALDLAGWGFILWARIDRIRARTRASAVDSSSEST